MAEIILNLLLRQLPKPRSPGPLDTFVAQQAVGRVTNNA